ncbi:MAG: hypothetical protein HRT53_16145 [Colwellia sp.]|nr:hypothetical protein [Colwellia sp.]
MTNVDITFLREYFEIKTKAIDTRLLCLKMWESHALIIISKIDSDIPRSNVFYLPSAL